MEGEAGITLLPFIHRFLNNCSVLEQVGRQGESLEKLLHAISKTTFFKKHLEE
jgi:hypothetical protein